MKILIVGGGGREHTLAWKIKQSKRVEKIYCAPGNAGIESIAHCVPLEADNIKALADFAKKERIDLTVVGPEDPLAQGISDHFKREGLKVFGPVSEGARLEGSKVFAKEIMTEAGVPTADYKAFSDYDEAVLYLQEKVAPIVVKADGLAAGKGVVVAKTIEEAQEALHNIMVDKAFGQAGNKVVIEECLTGQEASILAFTDGKTIVPMVPSQDHKPVYDGDKGPNTGGMGAYAPAPLVDERIFAEIKEKVLEPVIRKFNEKGIEYKGVIYAGLMIDGTKMNVLEFNVRFGDPETQIVLPLLKTDLIDIMEAVVDERLADIDVEWYEKHAVCVVMASGGYPGVYEKGKVITGLEDLEKDTDLVVFHAGTKKQGEDVVTAGGRVLGVTAWGESLKKAQEIAYEGVAKISFSEAHYRQDIGAKALK